MSSVRYLHRVNPDDHGAGGEVDAGHDECPEQVLGQVRSLVRARQLLGDHILEEHEAEQHHYHETHLLVRAGLQEDREHADDRHDQHRHDQVVAVERQSTVNCIFLAIRVT